MTVMTAMTAMEAMTATAVISIILSAICVALGVLIIGGGSVVCKKRDRRPQGTKKGYQQY